MLSVSVECRQAVTVVCTLLEGHVCAFQELTANPQFFVGGASRFDVQQGELGNVLSFIHLFIFFNFLVDIQQDCLW